MPRSAACTATTPRTQFNKIWSAHNGFFVDYTTGVATKDQAKMDKAVQDLTTVYVPQFADFLAGATDLPKDALVSLITDHVLTTKAIVDAQGAKDVEAAAAADRMAGQHMEMIGDPLATGDRRQAPGQVLAMGPRSRLPGVTRAVAAAAAILVIAAGCNGSAGGSAPPTSSVPASPAAGSPSTSPAATTSGNGTKLEVRDFTLEPLTLTVDGPDVELDVGNGGPTVHNVTIRDASGSIVGATRDLREGEADVILADLAPGDYVLFCSLPGHESLGIKGQLTVNAP